MTLVAVLGGMGVLPADQGAVAAAGLPHQGNAQPLPNSDASDDGIRLTDAAPTAGARGDQATGKVVVPTIPANSGTGRRVVFAMGAQRVWLVDQGPDGDTVARTYLVSGSVTDNLKAGTYSVYSKSEDAVGVDDSGTMKYMVRFTRGDNAAIGFHDIPVLQGERVQTRAELGTPAPTAASGSGVPTPRPSGASPPSARRSSSSPDSGSADSQGPVTSTPAVATAGV